MIEDPQEHDRLLTIAEELMDKGDALSPEERKLVELLVLLIELFEREVEEEDEEDGGDHALPLPHETLQRLLQARGWDATALNDVFGNTSITKDALEGRRTISKGQAKALGKLFGVPNKLFFSE